MARSLEKAPLALALWIAALGACTSARDASHPRVRGRVLDPDGKPVAGARVHIDPRKEPVLTDSRGRFNARVDRSDPFESATAEHDDFLWSLSEPIEFDPKGKPRALTIRLRRGGRITVRRIDRDDAPAFVFVSPVHSPHDVATARIANGVATLERLQPDWTVVRVGVLRSDELTLYDAIVPVADGETVELDFAPAVERRVLVRIDTPVPPKHYPAGKRDRYSALATLPNLRWSPSIRVAAPDHIETLTDDNWRSDPALLEIASPVLKSHTTLPCDFAPWDSNQQEWAAPTPGSYALAIRRGLIDSQDWQFEPIEIPDRDAFSFTPLPWNWRRE